MADKLEDDEGLFSVGGAGRDIRVPVLLDADEYLFLQSLTKSRGISASSYFRAYLNDERRRVAHRELSLMNTADNSAEYAQNMNKGLAALAQILKPFMKD